MKLKLPILTLILSVMMCSCQNKVDLSAVNAELEVLCRTADSPLENYVPLSYDTISIKYKTLSGDGGATSPYCVAVTMKNVTEESWSGVLRFQVSNKDTSARFFMPGFMYGRNRGDVEPERRAHPFPRLRVGSTEKPYSDFWMVRSDRLSHPVSMMYTDGAVIGISANPYFTEQNGELTDSRITPQDSVAQYNGYGCSLEQDQAAVIYTVGYENAPIMYIDAATQTPRKPLAENCVTLPAGKEFTFTVYIYAYKANNIESINEVIKDQYARYHQSPRKAAGYEETVNDISSAIYNDSWVSGIKNYATQVFLKDGKVEHNPLASIGWTGGVEVATPQLLAALRTGDEQIRTQSIECIDNIVKNSLNPKSGLPYDAFSDGKWTVHGWWSSQLPVKGHTSYLAGHCTYYILKAYDYEKRYKNIEHKEWMTFVEGILKQFASTASADGEFPYVFSEETGQGIDYDSFAGAWCLASLLYYNAITGDDQYLDLCRKSEQHYYDAYLSKMECYGTPHDTYKAVDSEGILSYIKATKLLNQITSDPLYVERLGKALDYEFTFKFCYNVINFAQPLKKIGWSSCGGSITSTCNPHIHPMSSNVADEIIYYWQKSGDDYYKQRLDDVIGWGLQCHNRFDGEYDYGKKGWMSERYCYSEALLVERYPSGDVASTWFCFLPWGASNIIEGLCGDAWDTASTNR